MSTTTSKYFLPDVEILYATLQTASYEPNFGTLRLNRRAVDIAPIGKELTSWEGAFSSNELSLTLSNTDSLLDYWFWNWDIDPQSQVTPLGKEIGIMAKVSENPQTWEWQWRGNIVRTRRSSGLLEITAEDGYRNLMNSQFSPDYIGIATFIQPTLWGTVDDIIGSNVYISDKIARTTINVTRKEKTNLWGIVFGAVTGLLTGLVTGNPLVGLGVGAMGGLPAFFKKPQEESYSYIRVTDWNIIPDNVILGGQSLKFTRGSLSGVATGANGALYGFPAYTIRGGTFVYGGYGTIEIDDMAPSVYKGDYVYVEKPLIYVGSPDDIVVSMLTGSNTTVNYTWPDDFADTWNREADALRHIVAWKRVTDLSAGAVVKVIQEIAKEFNFSFFINEENKFAIRTMLPRMDIVGSSILATISEQFNVIGNGISREDDIRSGYTGIEYRYYNFLSSGFQSKYSITIPDAATYYTGQTRIHSVDSEWMHEEYIIKTVGSRLTRFFKYPTPKINADVSLYSVPIFLGDVLNVTSWASGTNKPYEVVAYEKDFARSIVNVTAEEASKYWLPNLFYIGSTPTGRTYGAGGLADLQFYCSAATSAYGAFLGTLHQDDVRIRIVRTVTAPIIAAMPIGQKFMIGGTRGEVFEVAENVWNYVGSINVGTFSGSYSYAEYRIKRAVNGAISGYLDGAYAIYLVASVAATTPFLSPSLGTALAWF